MQKNDVAIVGMACRFPGAEDYHQFWDNLKHGRSHISEIPRARWDWKEYGGDARGPSRTAISRWGGFIKDVDAFDAAFFSLSPLEVENMDPQQRIMLELAWSCIEDAALSPDALSGSNVAVFLGTFNLDYKELQERELRELAAHHSTGTAGAVIANRISHFFNFFGPSVAVDTASSASLHALHLAVQSLNQNECSVALAGGISLLLTPARHISFSKTGMLSPTGSCKTFDKRADGYVRGEGAGLVLLKPLADAIRDGDSIYGIIKGSAANHSGKTRTLTYPNDEAQARVIADAILRADIPPDTISYVEAHGTGTPTGDPVEIQGLVKGFKKATGKHEGSSQHNFCGLGSVKTNIGHLESAAGIAGVIKVLLSMAHKQLPGLQNHQELNPRIILENTPFHVVDSLREWKPLLSETGEPIPRRAGVSSFGFGGTNAHVILEEAPPPVTSIAPESHPAYLICLSAKSEEALAHRLRALSEWIGREGDDIDLIDVSATLLLGRAHFNFRTALVVRSVDELREKLSRLAQGEQAENCFHGVDTRTLPSALELAEAHPTDDAHAFHFGAKVPAAEYTKQTVVLAEMFAKGSSYPWKDLFSSTTTKRLHLPTYAFARQRFWVTPSTVGTGESLEHEELEFETIVETPASPGSNSASPSKTGETSRRKELAGLSVEECVEWDLKSIMSRILKLTPDQIYPNDKLSDHGFDSISNTQLAIQLSEHYGIEVTPSLFYAYFTLEQIKNYLIKEHGNAVERVYAATAEVQTAVGAPFTTKEAPVSLPKNDSGSMPRHIPPANDDAIAIIGMSGRFPRARTIDEFWAILFEGRDVIGPLPEDRLESWRDSLDADATQVKGGWLPGAAEFDPLFFEISPKEAEAMDPRQRLLLQEAWRALEDAGYGAKKLQNNKMGMFVGAEQGDYHRLTGEEETLTSSHDGIMASRLGYFLNFSGPVLSINTACSAGLAAVHQACLSLRNNECDTALAAGVNILATPQFFKHASQAGMLSRDGVCYAFDKRANGMVMAEAVAVVVLKRLSQAVADGDRIHAVIKASGINYDGKTNGITAPSQSAQAKLLRSVYEQFHVNPAEIECVVAHGTGTRLGDPIEVNALAEVFCQYSDKKQYCALTSTKSNVGHTLAASGVVSLIGLVQALRHEVLLASLHCEQESDYINWKQSPFYVNRETRPWLETPDRRRMGTVSSFGISGTNAHVVVESYAANEARASLDSRPCYVLAVSAKTDEALTARVEDLLLFFQGKHAGKCSLAQISATLLEGRHHFAHRCALIASTHEEAEHLLKQIHGREKAPNVFRGASSRDFQPQSVLAEYGNELISRARVVSDNRSKYQDIMRTLADLYCQGYELDWENLFGDQKPTCVSLPTYPFAREIYWAAGNRAAQNQQSRELLSAGQHIRQNLHPLLDSNDSTLEAQKFSKRLFRKEFFLRDHVVDGKILLPGVAHLEMAYNAAKLSTGSAVVTLQDIIWGLPIVMDDESMLVNIGLTPLKQDTLEYLIYSERGETKTVFSQGRVNYARQQPDRARATINIREIQARCTFRRENAEIFSSFLKLGFGYGPTFQAIETLYCGETEALAKIVLADGRDLDGEFPRFTMHPSLFDAALNTLRGIGKQDDVLRIPFSLEALVVFAPIPRLSYCYATIHRIALDGSMSVNLSICDESGAECVRAVGLVFKAFTAKKDEKLHYYVPRWAEKPVSEELRSPGAKSEQSILVFDDDEVRLARLRTSHAGRLVQVKTGAAFEELARDCFSINRRRAQDFDQLLTALRERGQLPHAMINLWPLSPAQPELTLELESLLYLFQAAHKANLEREIQHLSVVPLENGLGRVAAEALSGFARSMTPVNHLFRMSSLQLDAKRGADDIVGSVLQELRMMEDATSRGGHEIRYADGTRSERVLEPWAGSEQQGSPALPLKEKGVYLISGGAGELGLHFGKYLAQQCRARLVLLGRRALNAERREKIAALEAAGAEVMYLVCNVAERDDVSRALSSARERFGKLDGVFHSAGIVGSTSVKDAVKADFDVVLAPKVHGTIHLDELTKEDSLDFFVLFSSISAHVGDFGQGSYAAANRFLDAYAHYREALRADGKRRGRSISVDWPYWDEGGMLGDIKENEATKTLYYDYSGMRGLKTEEGLQAFLKILASSEAQVVVTKGQQQKIEKVLRVSKPERAKETAKEFEKDVARDSAQEPVRVAPVQTNPSIQVKPSVQARVSVAPAQDELFTKTAEYLKGKISQVFKIPKARLDASAELGQYGIESIQIMELMRLLGKDFESIPGTLFFEYRTIQDLARYFTKHQAERLKTLLNLGQTAAVEVQNQAVPTRIEPAAAAPSPKGRFAEPRLAEPRFAEPSGPRASHDEPSREDRRCRDVAIIGISGRYPKAWNVDEFWKVLEQGQDCIEEIPAHRWDKNKYYDPEKKPGKTNSKWGGFIDGVEYFDALFFNMSPNQAALTDPQGRLFLQSAWEAMEDAGYTRDTLCADSARKVGVYLGMMWNEYQLYSGEDVVLSDRAAASNAVSYFFNLNGQSLTVDTACSSSLYAIAMACESIRNGTSSLAFAGGANLSLHPNKYVSLSQMNFFATDGRCRSFGKGGTGYVPGEGVGCVLLKPLDKAIEDGDHIYGVIRGVAVNHGGKTNGMTVPNPLAQADMVVAALEDARISPEDISYIEGHGTGTSLGDPIEISGLTKAFRKYTEKSQFCPIGSVKSNIGHLEGAAGVVAVTKVLMQMKHGTLVPSLHSAQLNPYIDFSTTPFYVQQKLEPWKRPTRTINGTTKTLPRIAGVSSFGAHGAIAHVIIEEYVPPEEQEPRMAQSPHAELIVLSAKDGERLREKAQSLLLWLSEEGKDAELANIAYTLQVGREAMEERLALSVETHDALREKLKAFLDGKHDVDGLFHGQVRQHKDTIALFKADEEMQEAVEKWIQRGKYEKLMDLWVKGLTFDWTSLARSTRPRRISLPTYPFVRERHWLAAPQARVSTSEPLPAQLPPVSPVAPASVFDGREERAQPLAFVESWEPQALGEAPPRQLGSLICFCSGAQRQAEVTQAVRAFDPAVSLVFIAQGNTYRKLSANSYEVPRTESNGYVNALLDIKASHGRIDGLLNLWALESESRFDDFSDVVFILQAVAEAKVSARRLVLAGQYRNGIERSFLEANIGFERSLGLVMPQLSVVAVLQDLADPKKPAGIGGWMERLLAELRQEKASSSLYRDGKRFVNRIRPVVLAERSDALKRGGTYLITGGCGGIGMIMAEHLARNYHANLILTGRSPLNEARQEKLRGLSAAGAQALYVQADVSNANDMKHVVERARERFGAIHGVIHAAGVQGKGSILKKSMRSFMEIVEPKTHGTLVLDQALAGEAIDFICYFSSTSAVIGDFGTCDYAVGNRFQMAYAAYRNEQAKLGHLCGKAVVINWPLWREGGMGFDEDSTKMYLQSSGQSFLETKDGIELFERLLSQDGAQHMLLVGKPSRVSRFLGLTQSEPSRVQVEKTAPVADTRRKELRGLSLEQCLEWDLKEIISRLVNVSRDKIYEDDNLADYGFDSVSLTELAARFSKHFGVEVTPSLFYGYSTLRKLRGYFANEHKERLSAVYGDDSALEAAVTESLRAESEWFQPAWPQAEGHQAERPQAAMPEPARPQTEGSSSPQSQVPHAESDDAIAIIGMSGRFPGARDVEELWSILADGRDVVSHISDERLALWGEPKNSVFGAFRCGQIPGPSEFDPLFFEISPKEARSMDPRQRLLLQESWRALEDAGWKATTGKVGMFVGVEQGDYGNLTNGEGSITANHDGILAARLAYFLDFSGPVMAINTACSSGLVAAHQACMSIRNGECETALAAGVSLVTAPQLFTGTKQAGMLSDDGTCYAFDKRANGMVIGEAVAVVVLKRLSKAIADGDRIHAVIRASGINYDGKSNGITAPNGPSQVNLLSSTYERYKLNPEDISYVIAHGTGTRLGDPIEINALNDVFKRYTRKQQYCALTSIKSNVGHTLAASGIVSLIGIVQALRHETIPASLHCEQESEYITWKESPFYVNKTSKKWPDVAGRKRVAALSSFGMSGTNAHMVVESFSTQGDEGAVGAPSHLLVLSAKCEESLQQRVSDLIAFLESAAFEKHSLRQVSATLLEGRLHFQHRCAVVARDVGEALNLLRQLARREKTPGIFEGKVPKSFTAQKVLQQSGNHLLLQADFLRHDTAAFQETLNAIADLYCQGYDLEWQKLFGGKRLPPISLPGYPFVRKHCWPLEVAKPAEKASQRAASRHPFVQSDFSNGSGPRLGAKFTGQEFFLRDHVVAGEKVFPGVGHLEMARAAHEIAVAEKGGRTGVVTMRDVVWMRPIKVGDTPLDVHISLEQHNDAGVRYKIVAAATDGATAEAKPVVHSQGLIVVGSTRRNLSLDLERLRAECSTFEIAAAEAYAAYRRKEIHYGPAFQGMVQLFVGASQVLAKLSLPQTVEDTLDQFVLHPSLLDAALQASIGLLRTTDDPYLPYAMEELEILGPCTSTMWAWIRRNGKSDSAAQNERLDIDLCDAQGNVSVRIKAFSTRSLKRSPQELSRSRSASASSLGRPVLMKPNWEAVLPQVRSPQRTSSGRTLLVGDDPAALGSVLKAETGVETLLLRANDTIDALKARLARDGATYDRVIWIAGDGRPVRPDSDSLIRKQEEGVYAGFRLAKALLALGYERRTLEWTVVTVQSQFIDSADRVEPTHAGVHGLMGSLAKEAPLWRVRLIDVEDLQEEALQEALSLPPEPSGSVWGHRNGRWYKQTLVPIHADSGEHEHGTLYRHGGVYVIIGGAGGLGVAWTEHMVRRYQAQVIWIGRRPKDESIQTKIDELALVGPAPWYLQADASEQESLAAAVREIKTRFPKIHGVVHSAIALLDQSVARMTEERFKAAVRAKVDVSVRMAQVFQNEPLDFVLFFSSLNSFLKSAGQSNYVCGCVFKDAFARLLAQSWPCAVKVMNWGYWGSVGIVASDKYHKRMEQDGIGSIEPAEGMDALDVLLSGPFDQLALMKTTRLELGAELVADGVITEQPNDANSLRATALSANERHIQRIIADSGRARGFDDDLLCELLITQLQALGMKTEGSGSLTELKGKLKPDSVYGRWLDESLRVLSDNGYLECSLDRYSVTHKAPRDGGAVWKRWETLCRDSKGANPYINLLDQAIRECPRVLTGQKLATDVIFPNSSMSLVEGIYRRCDSADALNEIVADLVATSLETMLKRDSSRRVRIFEIGSGTGGTSAKVLQKIKPHQSNLQEYCYTDLSKYFLLKGQKEFGAEHPYVQYKLFNVEQSPVAQGVDVGSYDIVLATNVLHATRDVRAAVRHAKSLLSANGMLILNELAANTLFSHLTFGLLEGWWLYRDPELRLEGCPGLSPAGWQTVLQEERFPFVSFPASKAHDFGHQIVVAQQTGGAARAESGALVRSAPQESARLVISGSAGPRAASDSEVKEHVQHTIVSQIQKSLSLDASEIHEDDAFVDYGVDSILGVQLIQDLNEALGVTLVTTDLFDYSSVRQLAAYVADTYPNESRASLARSRKESDVPPRAARDSRADDSAALESRVKEVIIAQIQKSLGLDRREIGEDDAFMDYGVDSILGVELIQDLNAALGITLVTTDLFDNSSVLALARYVTANYRDALSSAFAELHRPVAEESAAPAQNVPTSAATFTPEPTLAPQKVAPVKKEESHREPIAIIGMSGKFGKAKDVRQLWEHLVNGDALVEEIKRWDLSKYHAPGASYCNYASLMDDVEQFDPMFFKISGLEATYMDPQQRMVLEESWKALEDAGYAGAAVQGQPCGVYIGTQISDYLTSPTEEAPPQAMWGNAESLIPARISYYLDLQGPAIAVDTACSGSLVAIHLACQALRAGEVKMALAGGVSVQCAPDYYLAAQKAGMLSPTGRCHTFDERADGFVPGEGVGVVVLKRLRDALADGDHIYGVVRGSGLNQDGTSNGITAPSAKSQERLERAVYDTFAINPADIQMVEAHGTGTKLGDPIEFHALSRAFRSYTDKKEFCAIGSIKTNIGHAAPASGVAGLIKILLALEHKKIPRSLHFQQGNAHIAFKDSPFYVNTVHRDWTVEPGRPRLAALSSFGFSGTNAHMVIEEAPQRERSAARLPAHLVVLSAFSREQLRTQVSQLLAYLRRHPDVDLGDISLTLLLGRRHCHVRLACVAQNVHELTTHLQEWLSSGIETQVRVADLSEHAPRPQSSLEQYGNACLRQCAAGVEKTAYLEHLAAIRDLYLQGYELEYAQLFAAGTHKRLPLPTYPFQRQRYWLPETVQSQRPAPAASEVRALVERKDERDHMALAPFWSRDGFSEPAAVPSPKGNVVIIGGDASARAKIAAFCTAPHFLSITSAQSVDAITATLRRIGAIQSLIWIAPVDGSVESAALLQRTDAGVVALFKLLKALFALGYGSEDLNWTVVTRQAQPVLQGEPVNPAEASVLGLVGVMAKEYPNWSVRSLDIGVDQDLPVHALFSTPSQAIRALRNGQWFRQVLAKVTLPAQTQSLYRKAGVYVVLGGAGGIGELWSEDVIRRFQAQVVWIGRREKDSAIQQKIDKLGALGRPPLYVSADASNLDALRVAYAQIKQRFGTINGVVQSAFGVVDRSLPNTSEEQFRHGLKSKIDASVCMAEVFGAEPLDFMLFFSSIASFSQTMGYCSYVAGNAFEDAFAHRLASELSYPVKVVNWGYWGAVGSGLDVPQHVRERIYQYGFGDIDPALAMDAVEKLLAAPLKQLAYLNTRKPEQFESFVSHESIRVLSPAARAADALTPQLPSRKQALLTVQTQVQSRLRELDALLAKLLWCELQSHGWFKERTFDVASFKQKNGVISKYERWLQECMKLFAQQGYLVKTGFRFLVDTASVLDRNEIASEWERSKREWLANPDLKASVILVDRTLQALTDILSGKIPAVDIIFPNSSLEYVEGIYKRNMIADYFNDIVGDCTVAWIERWLAQNADAKIRILEVGAGTGGTAATVLSRLQPYSRHIGEYCYTDLSRAFLIHGTQQFGAANPFLSCKIFDASKPLAAQGLEEGTYDLIIATNVLHATKDIRESLRNSKALLKPGGVIVVNEIVGNTVFGLLTFALLDGWWLYDDAELRTVGGPGLEPRMWKSVLEWEGFTSVEFPAADAHVLNQQIVVAVSDGVSRQAHGDVPPRMATQEELKAQAHKQPEVQVHTQRVAQPENAQPARVDGATLKENVKAYLKKMLAQTLMIPIGSIDVRAPLSTYGIDSILILQLTNILKNELGQVSSTLFFEYRTIEALADYFVAHQREAIARLVNPVEDAPRAPPAVAVAAPVESRPSVAADFPMKAAEPRHVRQESEETPRARTRDIAIIGMSARFPQADTMDAYWENLRSGKNCITEIPSDRWALDAFYEPDKERAIANGKSYSKWGGFVQGFAEFDPLFFEISPNEAMEIDPQERLFLQETWKAFEDAGYTRARLEKECDGQVGVFVGVTRAGFNLYGPELWRNGDTSYPFTSFGSVANRISFKMNLNGPSMPIDTMCSSSLTALHEACEHLLRGDCSMAVTGGVNLYLHPSSYINLCNLQMLSDEGKCRSFGHGGNGFVPGEGVGVLILKRLEDAERDNDHIYAVIRGTSINHGGTTNGYTVPNPVAQGKVIRKALDKSGVDARTISYVEAHGTGTALGDPVEINGLTRAFSSDTQDLQYCAIGSCKSNIGHAEAAAGIAGVCKVVLQMRHGQLAPSLHAEALNPHIDFATTPFVVQQELTEWKRPVISTGGVAREVPRRAGVSSFGAGGANAHVVIEEYIPKESAPARIEAHEPAVVVLSAKNEERLREQVKGLLDGLRNGERREVSIVDIAHTLQVGREAMSERLGMVVGSVDELKDKLQGFLERPEQTEGLYRGRVKRNSQALSVLTTDEDMSQVLEVWIAKGKYGKVLEFWVNGLELDWRMLHPGRKASIVSLPTYPFARERYWIAEKETMRPEVEDETESTDNKDSQSLIDEVLDGYLSDELNMETTAEKIRLTFNAGSRRGNG